MSNISSLKNSELCVLSGDGRCDSPEHNAKYMTYSMLDQNTNKIIAMSLVQVTEAGNSNRMEKVAFINVLNSLKAEELNIKYITTDRHSTNKEIHAGRGARNQTRI